MKRILLSLLLAATMAGTRAQDATKDITSLMGSTATTRLLQKDLWSLDTLQMDSLYDYWNAYVEAHPKDEQAWRNLFEVNKERSGHFQLHTEDSRAYTQRTNVVGRMEAAIPGSYTFYYCAYEGHYEFLKGAEPPYDMATYSRARNLFADRAIELLPADASAWDYETWIAHLLTQQTGQDTTALTDALTHYYESGLYPAEALQYHFNELQGMEEGGIYLGAYHGDIIGKLILQYVLGVHRDKILYDENCASYRPYLEAVFERAGLSLDFFEPEGPWARTENESDEFRLIFRHICEHAQRPVYLSSRSVRFFIAGESLPEDMQACLYNEGLTMRYSAKPYDNLAVKCRNVQERYRLEYLRLAFQPSKEENNRQCFEERPYQNAFNYLLLLYDLMPYYKAHSPERHAWLNGIFTDILSQMRRQKQAGLAIHGKIFLILEVEEGGFHYELIQKPYTYHQSDRSLRLDKDPAKTVVLIKTEPIEC